MFFPLYVLRLEQKLCPKMGRRRAEDFRTGPQASLPCYASTVVGHKDTALFFSSLLCTPPAFLDLSQEFPGSQTLLFLNPSDHITS